MRADVVQQRRRQERGPTAGADAAGRSRGRASRRRPCARAGRPHSCGASPRREASAAPCAGLRPATNRPTVARRPGCATSSARNSRKPSSSAASRRSAGASVGRIGVLGGLQRANLELEPVAEALDATEHADRVALAESAVEQLDVRPDARLDAPARVDELEREVRRDPRSRPQALLPGDGVDALDDPVLGEGGNRAHGASLGSNTDGRLRPDGRGQAVSRRPLRRARRAARVARRASLRRHLAARARAARRARARTTSSTSRSPDDEPRRGDSGVSGAPSGDARRRGRARLLVALAGLRRARRRRARAGRASSPRCAPSRTRAASSCRTSAPTAARRKGAAAAARGSARSSSRFPPLRRRAAATVPTASRTSRSRLDGVCSALWRRRPASPRRSPSRSS